MPTVKKSAKKGGSMIVDCPKCSRRFVVKHADQRLPRHCSDEKEEDRCQGSNKPGHHMHVVGDQPAAQKS